MATVGSAIAHAEGGHKAPNCQGKTASECVHLAEAAGFTEWEIASVAPECAAENGCWDPEVKNYKRHYVLEYCREVGCPGGEEPRPDQTEAGTVVTRFYFAYAAEASAVVGINAGTGCGGEAPKWTECKGEPFKAAWVEEYEAPAEEHHESGGAATAADVHEATLEAAVFVAGAIA